MRILVAESIFSEFGWEIMTWQAHVRALAKGYDRVIAVTTAGREALYPGFDTEAHSIPAARDCWSGVPADRAALDQFRRKLDAIVGRLTENAQVTRIAHSKPRAGMPQEFIRYGKGERGERPFVVVHARRRRAGSVIQAVHNWPEASWDALVAPLVLSGIPVKAVGTNNEAVCPAYAEDLRGIPLQDVMNTMRQAWVVAGPSSGPMHLASLCGAPHVVWTHPGVRGCLGVTTKERYEKTWNPLGTPVRVLVAPRADPGVQSIREAILDVIQRG